VLSGDAFLRSIGAQALRGGLAKNSLILQFFRSALATLCFAKNPSKASHLVVFSSKSLFFTHIWTKIALFSSKSLLFTHIWTKIALFSSKSLLFTHIWTKIVGSLLKKNYLYNSIVLQ